MASEKIAPEKMTGAGKMALQEYRNLMQENLNYWPSEQFFDWSLYLIYTVHVKVYVSCEFRPFFTKCTLVMMIGLITLNDIQRPNRPLRFRHIPHRFPPPLWNVHDVTVQGDDTVQCEGWNNKFSI